MQLPFCPQPEPLELITSWLARVANNHRIAETKELLRLLLADSPAEKIPRYLVEIENLDNYTPEWILEILSRRSGIPLERLRSMTLAHWVPAVAVKEVSPRAVFASYIEGFGPFRHPPRNRSFTDFEPPIPERPWAGRATVGYPVVCPLCYERNKDKHYGHMTWAFGMVASCPWHEWPVGRHFNGSAWCRVRLTADWFTTMALRRGSVPLPSGAAVSAKWWLRFLRALIRDISHPEEHFLSHGDGYGEPFRTIWLKTGQGIPRMSANFSSVSTFEEYDCIGRQLYIQAASIALDLLMTGEIRPPPRSQAWHFHPRNRHTKTDFGFEQERLLEETMSA